MDIRTTGGTVGANLRRIRSEHGESQSDCARRLTAAGLSWAQSHVSGIESGKRTNVTIDELLSLSWAYRVPLATWFEGDGKVAVGTMDSVDLNEVRESLRGKRRRWIKIDLAEAEDLSADETIAARLGVNVSEVTETARTLWGHTATTERDARLSEHADKSPKELRTLRGGMTKRLRREIEDERGQ